MEQYIEQNGIPYKLGEDGLYYPQFELPKDDEAHYDKYGRMRYRYLKEHRELLFMQLVMEGRLNRHLNEVDDTANTRMELLIRQMDGLSPIRKLNQGYSYAENDAGRNVSEIGVVKRGDAIHIQVTDGVIHTEVTGTEKRKREF